MPTNNEEKIDTLMMVETPEGVELGIRLCGAPVRCAAWFFDFLYRICFYIVAGILFGIFGQLGLGIFLIVFFIVEWFYPVYFEIYHKGQTPGKKHLGIHVICLDGTPVSLHASLIRNFLRVVDVLPFGYGVALICTFLDTRFRRLGDLAGGTVVAYETKANKALSLPDVEGEYPPIHLSKDEQKALVSFAERCDILTKNRQLELSTLLETLHQEKKQAGLNKLLGYAKVIAGRE